MNKIAFTLLLFFAAPFHFSFAQQAILKGQMTEEGSKSPLVFANVQADIHGTNSDMDGRYELSLPAGEYEVSFSYVGFETKTEKVTLQAGETQTLDVVLGESSNILETATVTSGKHERALGEVTVSIDVIKPSLIESTNQTSLDGLLNKVPGVSMVGDQANIRGGSGFSYGAGSRVLLLVDDIPIYQADAGFPQWEDVPLENIEQVEVVKGAASALYGSAALNGIINVRTAYAKAKPETKIAPFYTHFMSPSNESLKWWDESPYSTGIAASHKRKIGRLDIILGTYYLRTNSYQDSSMSRRGRWNVNARYRITDRLSVGVNSNFNRSKGNSFFYWGKVGSNIPPAGVVDSLLYRNGTEASSSNSLRFNIDPYVTYFDPANNRHKLLGRFFSVDNNTGTEQADQSNRSDLYYAEYQFQRKMESIGLVLTTGFVYNGTNVRAPLYGDTTFTSTNLAGYLQLDKTFFGKLNVSGGFRFESNTILTPDTISYKLSANNLQIVVPDGRVHESKPVFRIGASYQINPSTFVRASWGQGYRFPTIAEKFIYTLFGPTPITPNPDLHSETGWTAELGLRKGFLASQFSGFLDVALFWSEYTDMMEFNLGNTFPPSFQSKNIGDTRIKGFEASITGRGKLFGLETTVLTGYTFIDPKFKEFDFFAPQGSEAKANAQNSSICFQPGDSLHVLCKNILKYRYRHTFKLDIETRAGDFFIGTAVLYNSNMENIDGVFDLIVPGLQRFRSEHDNGDLVWSVRTGYRFSEQAKLSLLMNNILNREYSSRPGKLEAPRHVTVRMDFAF